MTDDALLRVERLFVDIVVPGGVLHPVYDVSFSVGAGETVALVGESGAGKTTVALAVMGLLAPPLRVSNGSIRWRGRDVVGLDEREHRRLRGGEIAMVFQDPMSSLHPAYRVGVQVAEALRVHGTERSRRRARRRAVELLEMVAIPDPAAVARRFPHQLSGGMRQRVMLAMAVANGPRLLVADEPTTALDVTVQAQVLDVIRRVQHEVGAALLLVTHDLGVVAGMADRVAVMYAGRVVEEAAVRELFHHPAHPYTRALLGAVPRPGGEGRPLVAVPGAPPRLAAIPPGCPFHPRCPLADDECHRVAPPTFEIGGNHSVRCIRVELPALTRVRAGLTESVGDAEAAEAAEAPLTQVRWRAR